MAAYNKTRSILEKIARYCGEIEQITERFGRQFEIYQSDFAYRHACGMCILQIGELVSRLPEDFQESNKEIPWVKIRGMRNIFAHEYENVNDRLTWDTIEVNLPELKEFCEKTLRKMFGNDESCNV